MASVEKAEAAGAKTQRERDYIAAVGKFYKESDKFDHGTRALAYEKAMAELQAEYPDDREAPISMRRLRVVPSLRSDNRLANAAALLSQSKSFNRLFYGTVWPMRTRSCPFPSIPNKRCIAK